MTLSMPDSITPQNLPPGFPAYLGYDDGSFDTEADLRARFPGAQLVILTVTGAAAAHGVKIAAGSDAEPGNIDAAAAARWAQRAIAASPGSRPVMYADLATPGYSMAEVVAGLLALGITRSQYRILTAHDTGEAHICGAACGVGFQADGTQWTFSYPGLNGSTVDMSCLADDFFGSPPPWVFGPVRGLAARPGIHSVALTWDSPGEVAPGAVHHYQVTIRKDGEDVPSYPRDVPKGSNPQVWQGGSLQPGTAYVALVRAMTADGGHASQWSMVPFTTSG